MLPALLHGKLDRELQRSPSEIEDLLTSLVFGTCQYLPPADALLRFLARAQTLDGVKLGPLLGVTAATYEFWPRWRDRDQDPDADAYDDEAGEERGKHHLPDLVLQLDTATGPAWILVEAKLYSGKSSPPTEQGPITDQLARYWVQLRARASAAGAIPLAVVYVTLGVSPPVRDFGDTQTELARKDPSAAPAPLYWLSWREFTTAVVDPGSSKLLTDLATLLQRWQIVHARMDAWPDPPLPAAAADRPIWTFTPTWRWRPPLAGQIAWQFSPKRNRR